jgi:aminocarboxymuconate-semialdehyde decarboxylase
LILCAGSATDCSAEWTVEWQTPLVIWWAVVVPEANHTEVIDMHTHFYPPGLPDFAARTGDPRWPSLTADGTRIMLGSKVFRAISPECSDLDARSLALATTAVTRQVLSPVPITLTSWAEPNLANEFIRVQNNAFANEVSAAKAGHYDWMCAVPLQDPVLASAELIRSVKQLGAIGVQIGTEVGGLELDDSKFDDFYATAESLNVPIFVHPTDGAGAIRRHGIPYEFGLGMLTDTATAATALVFGGVLERHPSLRIGLAHGCGTFPFAYPRLLRGASLPAGSVVLQESAQIDLLVRRLWVDTLVFDPSHVPLLVERFGADHLMLGSDFPFYPPSFGDPLRTLAEATRCGYCSTNEHAAILGANAVAFFAVSHTGEVLDGESHEPPTAN